MFNFDNKFFTENLKICLNVKGHENIKENDLKIELMSNIPLIIQDGLNYCFSHRSFQEYFTAYYLANNYDIKEEVYENIGDRSLSDGVVNLTFDMDKSLLEDKWIMPKINKILKDVSDSDEFNSQYENCILFYDGCFFDKDEGLEISVATKVSPNIIFCNFLERKYKIEEGFISRSIIPLEKVSMLETYFPENTGSFSEMKPLDLLKLNEVEKSNFIEVGGNCRAIGCIRLLRKVKDIIGESRKNMIDIDSILF